MNEKITFIHLPKTGGTTLTTYLDDLFDQDRICQIHDQIALERSAAVLADYSLFRGHFMLSRLPEAARDHCRLMTVLRDPVRRVLSAFHHWLRDPTLYSNFPRSPLLHNHNIQTMALSPLTLKGYATLRDHLEAAKQALDSFFFVGIQEQLDEGCNVLLRLLGQPAPVQIRQKNVGGYSEQAPPALVDELKQANWADVDLHTYATALFKKRFLPLLEQLPAASLPLLAPAGAHDSLHYRMHQALIGGGWHAREGLGPADLQCWRWTGPGNESFLVMPLCPGVAYRLTIRVLNAVNSEVLNSLRVFIHDQPIELQQERLPWYKRRRDVLGGWLYCGLIPAHLVTGDAAGQRITIRVANTVPRSVADPASKSNMLCGLAISEINFDPI